MNVIIESNNLSLCGVSVRRDDDGRYGINDLHKASGSEKKHQPNNWLRSTSTKELIEILNDDPSSDMRTPSSDMISLAVKTIEGDNAGTFVCEELVYSYAMWISPRFHLLVIRTFRDVVTGQIKKPIVSDDKFLEKMVIEAGKRNAYAQSILHEKYGLIPREPKKIRCPSCQNTVNVDNAADLTRH